MASIPLTVVSCHSLPGLDVRWLACIFQLDNFHVCTYLFLTCVRSEKNVAQKGNMRLINAF